MPKTSEDSLQNILKGSTIVFFGIVFSMILNFLIRITLVRFTTQDQYGIYTLAITVTGMITGLAMLGMDEGSSRYIAYFLGKSDESRVMKTIYTSVKIVLLSGVSFTILSFLFSDTISINLFHSPGMAGILKIVLLTIPFAVMIGIMTSIMRGFNLPMVKVLFNDILRPLLYLAFLALIFLFNMQYNMIIYAYLFSFALTLGVFVFYIYRLYSKKYSLPGHVDNSVTRDLLQFSIPLLSVNMLLMMMSQATTLILGFYKTPDIVGEFDITLMMASLMLVIVNSIGYIYTPIVSRLFGKENIDELKRSYITTTKWGYLCTLPLFFMFLLFPQAIIDLLFGARYESIVLVLPIMVLGYVINPLTGPNYHTLISIGKTKYIIQSFLVNAILNLTFSLILIPPLGILGAAISVTLSAGIANVLLSMRLYQVLKIHPLTRSYISSICVSFGLIAMTYFTIKYLGIPSSLLISIVCLAAFIIAYLVIMILLKAVDNEDIMILKEIEKKIGINFNFIYRDTVK